MEAPECPSGSYAWRSILQGREVLKQGARRRIGWGDSVKIWDTPWLPSFNHPRILSPVLEGMQDATMDSLIDQQTRTWDIDVLNGFFAPLEVDLILKIPLSSNFVEDKWSLFG